MASASFFAPNLAWGEHAYGRLLMPPRNDVTAKFRSLTTMDDAACVDFATNYVISAKYPSGKKVFGCTQCQYVTDRKNNLKRHVGTMHRDCGKSLECCDVTFYNKAALREHVVVFHRSGYRCRYCRRNFCRKALLKRHLATHVSRNDFICSTCGYSSAHKSMMESHRRSHHVSYVAEGMGQAIGENRIGSWEAALHDRQNFRYTIADHLSQWRPFHRYPRPAHRFALAHRLKLTHCQETSERHEHYDVSDSRLNSRRDARQDFHDCVNGKATTRNDDRQSHGNASLESPDNEQRRKCGRRRLCGYPYKCHECRKVLPNQRALLRHLEVCKNSDPEPQRPLTVPTSNKQSLGEPTTKPTLWSSTQVSGNAPVFGSENSFPWRPDILLVCEPSMPHVISSKDVIVQNCNTDNKETWVEGRVTQTLPPKKRYSVCGEVV